MNIRFVCLAIAVSICLSVTVALAQRGGREGGRSRGGGAPGGEWSERSHHGGEGNSQQRKSEGDARGADEGRFGRQGGDSTRDRSQGSTAGAQRGTSQKPQASGAEGAAAANRRSPQTSGAQGAAAANRRQPNDSGAQGAAAGAAAANRRSPQYSGAQGAAAGAAAANRNQPNYSGAQGAAAGAAAANRNSPQYSGAQGAAAGAAAANRNAPTYSAAQGAAAGAVLANQNMPAVSGAAGAAMGSAAVRNSFDNPNLFGEQWYAANAGAFAPTGWAAGAAWSAPNWSAISNQVGVTDAPVSYDYGVNVTCQNGNVAMNGQNLGSAEEFSQKAADLAQSGADAQPATTDEWLPLGVFAMVRNEQQHPHLIMQLGINKQGVLRGNFTDEVTESTQPVQGAVDPKTQRAAWTVGSNKVSVMEAGLSNLVQGDVPALIHKNGKTDHWLLVRLSQPQASRSPAIHN